MFGVVAQGDRLQRIGVQRGRDGTRDIKVNSEIVHKASDLARALPVLVLGPETVDLLLGPPALRRRFLNWGLFHVEPRFLTDWESAVRCLKQRNSLLRFRNASDSEIGVWSEQLSSVCQRLDGYRQQYFETFSALFSSICAGLSNLPNVSVHYRRGWAVDRDLDEVFRDQLESDRKRGFTWSGVHKADLEVQVNGQPAAVVCSRGELKILAWALYLSQGQFLTSLVGSEELLYLVDDLASELDSDHRKKVCKALLASGGQVVATGIELDQLLDCWGGVPTKLFHVERGDIRVMENQE